MRKRNVRGICAFLCIILLGCLIPAGEVQAQRALDVARERGYQLEERYQPAGSIITEINTGQILWQENYLLKYLYLLFCPSLVLTFHCSLIL